MSLSSVGEGNVMSTCNPTNSTRVTRCQVPSIPGIAGYTLVASRVQPVVINEVTIGSLNDRVWRNREGEYIFGAQLNLNSRPFDLTGAPFNANDLFRQVLEDRAVAIAYSPVARSRALAEAGRTIQGLNEEPPAPDVVVDPAAPVAVDPAVPADPAAEPVVARDNAWVDFRIDVNAGEPLSRTVTASASPWLLVRTRAPLGFSVQPFAFRLLNSDFADSSEFTEIFMPGFQPN